MSRNITPTFRTEINAGGPDHIHTPMPWNCRDSGRPNDANLVKWVRGYEESTLPGGCNEALGGEVVWSAEVIRQATDEVVASYRQTAAFVVLEKPEPEVRTIWNSDGTDGPVLICPPPKGYKHS